MAPAALQSRVGRFVERDSYASWRDSLTIGRSDPPIFRFSHNTPGGIPSTGRPQMFREKGFPKQQTTAAASEFVGNMKMVRVEVDSVQAIGA